MATFKDKDSRLNLRIIKAVRKCVKINLFCQLRFLKNALQNVQAPYIGYYSNYSKYSESIHKKLYRPKPKFALN